MKSKIAFKDFCKTQIEPFFLSDEEIQIYDCFEKYLKKEQNPLFDLKKGIVLRGVVGCGKTTMFKMAQRWWGYNPVYFMQHAEKVVTSLEEGFLISKYLTKEWCFDDLGTEQKANNYGKGVECFKKIIEDRYDKWKYEGVLTHFTTNITNEELLERYGKRAYERLKEMCTVVKYPSTESKRGKSVVKPLWEEFKKEPTEEEKKAIIRNSIKETLIKEYNLSLETGVNHVKDKFGVYFTTLENIGLLDVSKEQKIKMFENRRAEILKMKATSQEDWRDLDDFRKGKGGKANKYYAQCIQDCRAKCTEEYILGCLEIGFDLESEILKRL
jgi:hypothetical protein